MLKNCILLVLVVWAICSCGKPIGSTLTSRDDKHNKFYQTWDGQIHEVTSVSYQSWLDYVLFDGVKVNNDDIQAFQNDKVYYGNRWGAPLKEGDNSESAKKLRGYKSMSPMFFAERQIKGKLNIYYAVTYRDKESGSKADYFFQKGDGNAITPLRTFTLKPVIEDCKQCKVLLEDAVAEYERLPKWRKKYADGYVAAEKKLVNLLVAVVNEYNAH